MATAIRYVSTVANEAGIALPKMMAYIAVTSAKLQISAETVGQSYKTMLTRMQDIKAGKIDEDGLGINNVESALARVNIQLRSSKGEFRNLDAVLEEIAGKWDTMGETEQKNVAKAVAGVRQVTQFTALMQDMPKALDLYEGALEDVGLATERYKVLSENAAFAQGKFTASWEGMWQATMNSDGMIFLYNLGSALLDSIDKAGGLIEVLSQLGLVNPFFDIANAQKKMLDKNPLWKELIKYLTELKTVFADLSVAATDFYKKNEKFADNMLFMITPVLAMLKEVDEYMKGPALPPGTLPPGAYDVPIDGIKKLPAAPLKTQEELDAEAEWAQKLAEEALEASEKSQDAMEELLDMTVKMIKQGMEEEKAFIQEKLANLKTVFDATKRAYQDEYELEKRLRDQQKENLKNELDDLRYKISLRKEAARDEYDEITRNIDARKRALKSELDGYSRILDKQKALLQSKREELAFAREMEDKQESLAELENKILELSLDDSEEAIAERMRLEREAADLKEEMAETDEDNVIRRLEEELEKKKEVAQQEYDLKIAALEEEQRIAELQYDLRIKALEQEEASAERKYELKIREMEQEQENSDARYEMRVRELEDEYDLKEAELKNQIKQIEDFLSQEGTIRDQARAKLTEDSAKTYANLLEWNKKYGDGLNATVTNAWKLATSALEAYKRSLEGVEGVAPVNPGAPPQTRFGFENFPEGIGGFHSGVERGLVGGLQPNEVIARLTKGEGVFTPGQMENIVNNFSRVSEMTGSRDSVANSPFNVTIPITVNGNLDSSALPALEDVIKKVVERLNRNVLDRGIVRQTSATSI